VKRLFASKAFQAWMSTSTLAALYIWIVWLTVTGSLTAGVIGEGMMNVLTAVSIPAAGAMGMIIGSVWTYRAGGKAPPGSGKARFRQIVSTGFVKVACWLRFWRPWHRIEPAHA